jgi:OmpA-OmpF porin, OOP family
MPRLAFFATLGVVFAPAIARADEPAEPATSVLAGERPRTQLPWILRWAPERNMGELGGFTGVLAPSSSLELFAPREDRPDEGFQSFWRVTPTFGTRAGFYPSRFFGFEAEGGIAPTRTQAGDFALLWNLRGQLVAQIGLWSVTPFFTAGGGAIAVASRPDSVGNDVDWSVHFGGGAKFFLSRYVALRLDVRDVLSNRAGYGGVSNSIEALVGVSITLGRAKDPAPVVAKAPARVAAKAPPLGDSDGDGLMDDVDACAQEPETTNGYDDGDGCPDAVPVEVARFTGVIEGIFFETGSDAISPTSRPVLDAAVEVLVRYADVRVRIVGHTDDVGTRAHNMDLSRRRAEAVAAYLAKQGVESERIQTRGAGPDLPLVPNDGDAGRARNRRIEFQLVTPGDASP